MIGHGEFRRLLRQIEREPPVEPHTPPTPPPPPHPSLAAALRGSTGWSRPLYADHAMLAAAEAAALQAARARRRPGRPPEPRCAGRFMDGVEVLKDGTELHLASFGLTDAELRLEGADDPAFAELKVRYADVLGGAPAGMPPDRGMELELETGGTPMPWSRPVRRLSEGELSELRAQVIDLLDRGWIQHSTAGHAAAVVFARKPDGSWRICYDYRGLNAITRPAVEPLPHIDALLDGTRGSRFFSHHQQRVMTSDRWKTSFRSQLGRFAWNVVPFGLQGASSLPKCVMNQALTVGLEFPSHGGPTPTPAIATAAACSETAPSSGSYPLRPAPADPRPNPRWGSWGIGSAEPVRAGAYGRLSGALAEAGAAPARRRGGARDHPPSTALRQELQVRVRAPASRRRACRWTSSRCSPSSSGRRRRRAQRSDA